MKKYWLNLSVEHQEGGTRMVVSVQMADITGRKLHEIVKMATEGLVESGEVVPPIEPLPTATHIDESDKLVVPGPYVPPPKMKRRRLFLKKQDPALEKPPGFDPKDVANV